MPRCWLAGIPATGFGMEVKVSNKAPESGIFLAILDNTNDLGDEGYELTISKKLLQLVANKPAGIFSGIQTIRQLLPAEIELFDVQKSEWIIPTGSIQDYPQYEYRGSMLDVSRHFFGVEDIKRTIE